MSNYDIFSWLEETARAFDELSHDSRSAYSQSFPPMDSMLDEETGELSLEFALAGFAPEELEVTVSGDQLKLKGTKDTSKDEKRRVLRRGIKARDFDVRYQLPAGKFDPEKTAVKYSNGMLTIVFQPSAQRQPKRIAIDVVDRKKLE